MAIDPVGMRIIQLPASNSRLQWKEIGAQIHLAGQAVAARVRRLEEEGVIERSTILVNQAMMGRSVLAFITVFMASQRHAEFQRFVAGKDEIVEGYRISGDGCYHIRAAVSSEEALNRLLDEILQFGNYRLHLSIAKVK